jgi:hypothetical protein
LKRFLPYFLLVLLFLRGDDAFAQDQNIVTDSWAKVKEEKKGRITVLWCEIEPFIYRRKDSMIGVEYELMQGFPSFLKKQYGIDLQIDWVSVSSFEKIYPLIHHSAQKGLFALSYYSITEKRKHEVKFSPPYMPDLNIIVSSNDLPVYESDLNFISDLKSMKGFTMGHTTMEEDMQKLRRISPSMPIIPLRDDYEVMEQITKVSRAFGYVPLSIYIVALQKGIKIKRQKVLATRREGFAAIYTKASDWDEPVNAYFKSEDCRQLTQMLIRKHLGPEVANIILEVSGPDSIRSTSSDIELLTKEREIVTERLINTALLVQKERMYRNLIVAAAIVFLVIILILLNRFATKRKYTQLLHQRNDLITKQKNEIELINGKLQQKLILSQLNPHLIFNSLTAIQHFVLMDDKKMANKYLAQLSKFIRQILQNAEQPMVSVENEQFLVEQFLLLEQARFNFKFDYSITVNNGAAAERIPSMLIFPFVEQALYGRILKNSANNPKSMLHVHFDHTENASVISIKDNAIIDDTKELLGESTFGRSAQLAEAQIQLLNKNQDRKITLRKIQPAEGANHEFLITIPDNILL